MNFISDAYAETATTSPNFGTSLVGFVPLILIFFIFYFLIIRPQQKKIKEHAKMIDEIKKGDKVVIASGLVGTITKVDSANSNFLVEIAPGVEVKILKSSVSEVLNKSNKKSSANSSTTESSE